MWLFAKLNLAVNQLNRAYQYDLKGLFDGIQIASYSRGGKYDWHMDLGPAKNSSRKLSLSVQLSENDSYKGGNLEFANIPEKADREISSLIAFPSFLQHRVTPVTRGVRHSLVAWIHVHPFR